MSNSKKAAVTRREVLRTGGKYAALVPVSTLLVTKSARASGSVFVFPNGETATTRQECRDAARNNFPGAANRDARIAARQACRAFLGV